MVAALTRTQAICSHLKLDQLAASHETKVGLKFFYVGTLDELFCTNLPMTMLTNKTSGADPVIKILA